MCPAHSHFVLVTYLGYVCHSGSLPNGGVIFTSSHFIPTSSVTQPHLIPTLSLSLSYRYFVPHPHLISNPPLAPPLPHLTYPYFILHTISPVSHHYSISSVSHLPPYVGPYLQQIPALTKSHFAGLQVPLTRPP